jgi:DnaJ-class molecular chaperone
MSEKKTVVCEDCCGMGAIEDDECPFCLGEGRLEVNENETWEVSEAIPEADGEYDDLLEEIDEEEEIR